MSHIYFGDIVPITDHLCPDIKKTADLHYFNFIGHSLSLYTETAIPLTSMLEATMFIIKCPYILKHFWNKNYLIQSQANVKSKYM